MKIIITYFIVGTIALCFSLSTLAQSSQQDLDQKELTKKLIGKWTSESEGDTTTLWEVIPAGMGYIIKASVQAKGVTVLSMNGLMGFQAGEQNVVSYLMLPDGGILRDVFEFVSDTK